MPVLEWDKFGERLYQSGLDRGVLYPKGSDAVPWNGLVSVEADSDASDVKAFYMDGVKYLINAIPGDFIGKLTAVTYPDEFDDLVGIRTLGEGISLYDQPPKSFNLSYRTRIGSDYASNHGYKIHLLYNVFAAPEASTFQTLNDSGSAMEFSWSLTGTPVKFTGFRPTTHVTIDSTEILDAQLQHLEDILYGTDEDQARFPTSDELVALFNALIIVDNGDGTWTAVDSGGQYIDMLNSTTFEIDYADATYLDSDTYTIRSSPAESGVAEEVTEWLRSRD